MHHCSYITSESRQLFITVKQISFFSEAIDFEARCDCWMNISHHFSNSGFFQRNFPVRRPCCWRFKFLTLVIISLYSGHRMRCRIMVGVDFIVSHCTLWKINIIQKNNEMKTQQQSFIMWKWKITLFVILLCLQPPNKGKESSWRSKI